MRNGVRIGVVIPALNEEKSIGKVLEAIPDWIDDVVVADNGSSDRTADVAASRGARVVYEHRRGYGAACLAGIAHLDDPDIVLFMDGDYSDYPEEASRLIDPIVDDEADMVVGSRVLGHREAGALTLQALFGNWLSCRLMRLFWGVRYTDLGPFRAISVDALSRLHMRDLDYGWTVEMQIKAAMIGLRALEVPVSYRKRIGKSKVSGTVRGVIGAGTKILSTIARAAAGYMPELENRSSPERIIVFTRYPQPGAVKTRLAPVLGEQGAADLHRQMTEHIVRRVRLVSNRRSVVVEVRFDGQSRLAMSRWLGRGIDYRRQVPADLGERMNAAFQEAFESGSQRVLLVGSDCPGITAELLEQGLEALREHDAVFGPAADGGYYLVGLTRMCPALFSGITWGTSDVLQRTLDIAASRNLDLLLLATLHDVDRPEDLSVWEREKQAVRGPIPLHSSGARSCGESQVPGTALPTGVPEPEPPARIDSPLNDSGADRHSTIQGRISVIVPTRNEAESLPASLVSIGASDYVEIIVVDGGSDDETVQVAASLGAKTILCHRGRSTQMNRGAAAATGDILLFLHADTLLPVHWEDHVRRELARPGVSCGAFRFRTDGKAWSLRVVEYLANIRAAWFHMPYGDQALFVRADSFRQVGGFPDIPIMEDVAFVRQVRKRGRVTIAGAAARTSDRRWRHHGILRTTVLNQAILIGYFLGVRLGTLSLLRGSFRNNDKPPEDFT
jgi:uncharacterized protein